MIIIYAAIGNLIDAGMQIEKATKELHQNQDSSDAWQNLMTEKDRLLNRSKLLVSLINQLIRSQDRA